MENDSYSGPIEYHYRDLKVAGDKKEKTLKIEGISTIKSKNTNMGLRILERERSHTSNS